MTKLMLILNLFFITFLPSITAQAQTVQASNSEDPLTAGKRALQNIAGCYLVDYSYTETEALKTGYVRDTRVYDVNQNKTIKEYIYAEDISPTRIRLQHILFGTELNGQIMDGSFLRHPADDWEFNAKFLYDFVGPLHWSVKDLSQTPGLWTRRVTNLDDGLRTQCAAAIQFDRAYPSWTCSDYAPIPGREYRDMGRKDYNTLSRWTSVVLYGNSWLERQANTKIMDEQGVRTPLAKELGKNWYVRLPDSDCAEAKAWAEPQKAFWKVLREAWDGVYTGDRPFVETASASRGRYSQVLDIQDQYSHLNLEDPGVRNQAIRDLQALIAKYREN